MFDVAVATANETYSKATTPLSNSIKGTHAGDAGMSLWRLHVFFLPPGLLPHCPSAANMLLSLSQTKIIR